MAFDAVPSASRYSPEVVAAEHAERAARRTLIIFIATRLGFADVAEEIATALTTYRNAPGWGLGAMDDRLQAARIREGISAIAADEARTAA